MTSLTFQRNYREVNLFTPRSVCVGTELTGEAGCCHGDKRGVAIRTGIEETLELSPVLLRHNRNLNCACFTILPQSSHETRPTALFGDCSFHISDTTTSEQFHNETTPPLASLLVSLPIQPASHTYIHKSIHTSVYLVPTCPSIHPSINPSIHPSIHPSTNFPFSIPTCLSVFAMLGNTFN